MIDFDNLNGSAKKSGAKYMKLKDGENTFRIVGGILPGYTYWVKGASGKDAPFECLQFDRAREEFDNLRPDPVKELALKDSKGEPLRCSWSYKCQVINRDTGALEVLQLKKGMLQDIIKFATKQKINPTDFETGCDITVAREKTGPLPFNVAYSVDPFSMQSTALSDEDKELVSELKPIDELFKQETPDDQRERLQRHLTGGEKQENDSSAEEAISELE